MLPSGRLVGVPDRAAGLPGTEIAVLAGAGSVRAGVSVTVGIAGVGLGVEGSRPTWNVPRQAVMARKRITAPDNKRDFMEPPDLS
jgi:hypothetical protein